MNAGRRIRRIEINVGGCNKRDGSLPELLLYIAKHSIAVHHLRD